MNIEKTVNKDEIVFMLEGHMDSITSPRIYEQLCQASAENSPEYIKIVLDFKKLTYISSAGLRVLLMTYKTLEQRGGELIIKNISPDIMQTFRMTGFSNILSLI